MPKTRLITSKIKTIMTIQKLASDTRNTIAGHILLSKICDLQTLGMPLGKSEGVGGHKNNLSVFSRCV